MLKVLDCTLREGGYANDWNFGTENIQNIIGNLSCANIDIIECGYLKLTTSSDNKTIFNSLFDLKKFLKDQNKQLALMINFGEYDFKDIQTPSNTILRIAFKKKDYKKALEYCLKCNTKNLFLNPMHTNTYDNNELIELIDYTNKIQPLALTITDSTGSMREEDLKRILDIVNKNLDEGMSICFHCHDNLKLAFSNTKFLLEYCNGRDVILDSTLLGIGRGAGNLHSEIITEYLNKTYNKNYNTEILLDLIEKEIKPIYDRNPWGYSVPYYLSGLYKCHPNYAKFLIDKSLTDEKIEEILKKIPPEERSSYNEILINQLL